MAVASHDEKERETLRENVNEIETIIANQIHLVTDSTGAEKISCQYLYIHVMSLFFIR